MLVQKRRAAYMVHAPAKLNLFFEVRQRRHDGFHEIETLMIPVSLYDTLYLRSTPTKPLRTEIGKAEPEMAEPEMPAAVRFSCRDLSGGAPSSGDKGLPGDKASSSGDQASIDPHRRIPSDATNLAVRAVELLKRRAGVEAGAEVQLIKRIPAAAGLGGGSSDAAAALLAANAAWRVGWTRTRLMSLAAELGSDVPFFLGEGAAICRGRGELVES
jgi:4-diphosphocytidyl-2-C-methyl-D-erythritol kinase